MKVLRLRPTSGFAFDTPANEVSQDFFTGGTNVIFRDNFAQRIGGSRPVYTQNNVNPTWHLLNVRAPGGITESNFWLTFGTNVIKALETTNISTITGAALTPVTSPWQWSTTLLNNIPCFTNGLDNPRYWAGDVGTPATDLPGWPAGTICKSIVAFKFHLFALDIDGPIGHYESQITWSAAAAAGNVPATWLAAATNEAGSAILADTPSPCMCGVPLQDTLLVFKRSSTYAVNYIGGNSVFNIRLLDADRGALTRHAAVNVGGKVFIVTDGDVCLTDGVNWQSVAQGKVRDYLFGQLDQASYENLFVTHNRSKNEVWLFYPSTGNTYASEAIVYNVASGAWGIRTVTNGTCADVGVVNDTAASEAWDVDAQVWDADLTAWNSANFSLAVERMITGVNSATLTLEDDSAAVSVAATIFRHDLSMGAPERFKFVKRVHIRTNDVPGTLFARVGARNSPSGAIVWDAERTITAPTPYFNTRAQGKLISVEVRSAGTDIWKLTGVDLEYEDRGYI